MATVIHRHGHAIDEDGYIHYDDRPATYEQAEKIAGRRLDRRRNYAIIITNAKKNRQMTLK